ncbi:BREX-1 system adenine-specific DNA-methyltransferase PglX, partial [Ligilactobacillus pabuli]|uniref:BREX-1 system adenine-specific DNA-methyltransferase PglX n=1 Tax=Ligilactobacillus pabuli TaxID=2886039 RepID=UPI001FBA30D1
MDKNIIKKFAIKARQDLIEQVTNEANLLGINEDGAKEELASSTNEIKFYGDANSQGITGKKIEWRAELVRLLNDRSKKTDWSTAFADTVEEVAYTWFNRIIAIRFMEVNDYLPSRVRVLSSEEGRVDPDIIFYAQDEDLIEDLGGYSPEQAKLVAKAKQTGRGYDMDQMYQMLFNKQVDALNQILPGLFEKTSDYMKLLFTPKYNSGVIKDLATEVPEEYFDVKKEGQVEIIGWLYQYYNTEPHDKVVNITGGAVQKRDIPAATQLFTTDWVVRYMVDNSLGKYYLERHPDSKMAQKLEYLLPEEIETIDDAKDLTKYSLIDNAMGSGHILVYAFDVFMDFYKEQGYSSREAAKLILENNLSGMDIDRRAYQLSYFALMMKFRQYDRRAFGREVSPNLYCFEDTDDISDEFFADLCVENSDLGEQVSELVTLFSNASEIGAVLKIPQIANIEQLYSFVKQHQVNDDLGIYNLNQEKQKVLRVLDLAKQLVKKYDVAVTNPPYMNKFDADFKKYLKQNYKNYSKDLFSVFIYHNSNIITEDGYAAFMTPFVWMFIKSYEDLRTYLLDNKKISSLIQLEYSAFEEATVPINTFVIKNTRNNNSNGVYLRLSDFKGGMEVQKQKVLEAIENPKCKYLYRSNQAKFVNIPSSPIAYWASDNLIQDFVNGTKMEDLV